MRPAAEPMVGRIDPGRGTLRLARSRMSVRMIVGLALIVRVAWALGSARLDPFLRIDPLHGDAASYVRIARGLLGGHGYSQYPPVPDIFWPPIYPLFLAAGLWLFDGSLLAIRLVQAVVGAATVALLADVLRHAVGDRPGRLAALGLAVHPFLIYWGNWLIAEALFGLLAAAVLWLSQRPLGRRGLGWAVALGASLGVSVLTKPSFLFTVPFLLLYVLWRGIGALSHRMLLLGLVALVMLATIAPWTARNIAAVGEPILISVNGGYTFYGANNPDAFGGHAERFPPPIPGLSPAEQDRAYYRLGLEWIATHPGAFANLAAIKLGRLLSPLSVASEPEPIAVPAAPLVYGLYWGFLIIAVIGGVEAIRRSSEALLLVVPIAGTIASTIVFYGDTRYSVPMVPSLVAFASVAACSSWARWRARGARQLIAPSGKSSPS